MSLRIIAIDDEPFALKALEQVISRINPDTHLALFSDGGLALEYLEENSVDVAFIDISMPQPDGMTIAAKLQEMQPRANIIFVTGHTSHALDAFGVHASGYLLKPIDPDKLAYELQNLRYPVKAEEPRVKIQCFGSFGVFVQGKPLQIPRSKPKELLAYLVFENGASASSAKIASVLWENRTYDRSLRSQVQTTISQLMHYLKEAGAEDIIVRSWNSISVDPGKIDCDYYRFLKGDPDVIQAFTGDFLKDYSWAEITTAYLSRTAGGEIPLDQQQ